MKGLAAKGVKEIMLIAQALTFYGLDIYKKRSLSKLLDSLCEIEGIEWIRLHYAYPSQFPMDILETMARQPKICNYLDIPLQHAANNVLKGMRRKVTNQDTRNTINEIRRILPEIAIRTTMLVGFPGETEQEFEELLELFSMKLTSLPWRSPQMDPRAGTPASLTSWHPQASPRSSASRKTLVPWGPHWAPHRD